MISPVQSKDIDKKKKKGPAAAAAEDHNEKRRREEKSNGERWIWVYRYQGARSQEGPWPDYRRAVLSVVQSVEEDHRLGRGWR